MREKTSLIIECTVTFYLERESDTETNYVNEFCGRGNTNNGGSVDQETNFHDDNVRVDQQNGNDVHGAFQCDDGNEECEHFYNNNSGDDDDNNDTGDDNGNSVHGGNVSNSENEHEHNDDVDSDDDSDNDEEDEDDGDDEESIESDCDQNSEVPLYDDAPVSCQEFRNMLLALQQKHNFSSSATNNILKLFQVTLPSGNKCPSSNYKLENEHSVLSYSFKKTTTCKKCQHILDENLCTNTECCLYENDGLGENSSLFYVIDLAEEIKVFVSGRGNKNYP